MFQKSRLPIAMLLIATTLVGVENLPAEEKQTEPSHMTLVRELGATSYGQREHAAAKLIALGNATKPALLEGMQHEDLEIRLASHRVLVRMLQSEFDKSIEAFLNNADGVDVPGWRQFQAVVGDSQNTRRLFAKMLRAENDLLVALDQNDSSLEQKLIERVQFLTSSRAFVNGQRPKLSSSTVATILLVGVHAQKSPKSGHAATTISPTTSGINSMLSYNPSMKTVLQEAYSPQIRELLTTWIVGVGNSQEQYGWSYAMQLVLKYDMSEQGPPIARKILKNPGKISSSIPNAAFVLGRFGTVADAKHLETHLGNTQVFHTWSNAQLKKEPIRIQVRDAVLAMIIRLHGEDPASYGFKLLKPDEKTIYKPYSLGFLEDADRDKTYAKWKARSKPDKTAETAEKKDDSPLKPGANPTELDREAEGS